MIPAAFEYHVPKSLDEALRLLDQHGDEAKVLAGGHSLLPLMKLRLAAPRYVVDIGRIKQLDYIREHNGSIAIGAMATHAAIESSALLKAKCPLLAQTAGEIGDVQVRNRGTIGGSLAHADPAADYPAAILALEAELVASSTAGERIIAASDFFVDLLTTQLRPGEMLTEVRVPAIANGAGSKGGARNGAAYAKLHQPASGYALVGAAARVTLAANGAIERAVIGVTGVAAKAYRASAVEKALAGQKPSERLLAEAVRGAAKGVDVLSDIHASRDYRREMAAVFVRRALDSAIARAAGSRKANGRA
ncbi:MAG: FAD binding domain-containing protein [Candidatus Acidiferrales bacterium]